MQRTVEMTEILGCAILMGIQCHWFTGFRFSGQRIFRRRRFGLCNNCPGWPWRFRGRFERQKWPRPCRTLFGVSIELVGKRLLRMVWKPLPLDRLETGKVRADVSGEIWRKFVDPRRAHEPDEVLLWPRSLIFYLYKWIVWRVCADFTWTYE